ncbi:MAG: hypothetical protein ACI9D5_002794 [Candidatus Endobugula sp.]|jgi:hypothetical protein
MQEQLPRNKNSPADLSNQRVFSPFPIYHTKKPAQGGLFCINSIRIFTSGLTRAFLGARVYDPSTTYVDVQNGFPAVWSNGAWLNPSLSAIQKNPH